MMIEIGSEIAVPSKMFDQHPSNLKEKDSYLELSGGDTTFQKIFPQIKAIDDSEKEDSEKETYSDDEENEILRLTKEQNDLLSSNQKWDSSEESLDEDAIQSEVDDDNLDVDDWEPENINDDVILPISDAISQRQLDVISPIQLTLEAKESFQGLRLSNYRNDCYLNSALNCIITNQILMNHIQTNSEFLQHWIKEMLLVHSPSSLLPWDATKDVIMAEWYMFLSSPIECITEHGGLECYEAIKEEYKTKTKQANIIDEIQRLRNEKSLADDQKIENASLLKKLLAENYPFMECYSTETQEDAATPFVHVIESIPYLVEKFRISGQKNRKCLECGREEVLQDDTNLSMYLNSIENEGIVSLENKVQDWCDSLTQFEKKCECTIFKNDRVVEEMYKNGSIKAKDDLITNTVCLEKFEVLNVPKVLHIRKTKMANGTQDTEIPETMTINEKCYILKSALLYIGSGTFGHWRALSREGENNLDYVLYNDASEPKRLKPNEELIYLQMATDFIYIQTEGPPKKKPIEIDKNPTDSGSEP